MMDEENGLPDFKDLEIKLGRKIPESLIRSFNERDLKTKSEEKRLATPVTVKNHTSADLKRLESKMLFLKQEMAHLRAIDVKLMHQLLTINDGIESIRWVMEERAGVASRESSLTGSLYSLSDSQDTSQRGSCNSLHDCSDSLDGISVGSYLDTLGEDLEEDLGEDLPNHPSPTEMTNGFPEKSTTVDDEDLLKKPPPLRPRVETDEYYIFG
ncbi:leucine rich adaptor protein 1-like isoform X1 [Alosa pseudoharengus]|uniref:leucine rich adaptor protein 1-like isoform X1 n=1 Tax=Alosa pseudoharengus TaxID=34774 RepID=UPI003F8B577D